jgi:hypothetical protein
MGETKGPKALAEGCKRQSIAGEARAMIMKTATLALASLLLAGPAAAGDRNGTTGELRSDCRSQNPYCYGYINGVAEQAAFDDVICWKGNLSTEAAVQIFLNWADKNPKYWGMTHREGVIFALTEAFPCKR